LVDQTYITIIKDFLRAYKVELEPSTRKPIIQDLNLCIDGTLILACRVLIIEQMNVCVDLDYISAPEKLSV
jgi:hypothetical protein